MTRPTIETSPQAYARAAGGIYLLVILFGGLSEGLVMDRMLVSGDMAQTARNITGGLDLWNLSGAANLIVPVIGAVQLWIEYLLFRPVSRTLALLFLIVNLASLAVEAVSKVFLLMVAPLLAAGGSESLGLAHMALLGHNIAFQVALIYFGLACLLSGHLICKSGFLPRLIGRLMQIAGVSYLVACFTALFAPAVANVISPAILLPPLIGESALCLWLLVKGVDLKGWRARVAAAA